MEDKNITPEEKQAALKYLKETIAKIPPSLKIEPEIIVGSKTLTPEQLISAIEGDTEEGNLIITAISRIDQEFKRSA